MSNVETADCAKAMQRADSEQQYQPPQAALRPESEVPTPEAEPQPQRGEYYHASIADAPQLTRELVTVTWQQGAYVPEVPPMVPHPCLKRAAKCHKGDKCAVRFLDRQICPQMLRHGFCDRRVPVHVRSACSTGASRRRSLCYGGSISACIRHDDGAAHETASP
jgi:hypothetical protein